jgi:acyl-CoA reductase-like NAD-dependent aldehyde dehydrogenase
VLTNDLPWGGYKEYGYAKENSILCREEYYRIKHVWIDLTGCPVTPWQNKL